MLLVVVFETHGTYDRKKKRNQEQGQRQYSRSCRTAIGGDVGNQGRCGNSG